MRKVQLQIEVAEMKANQDEWTEADSMANTMCGRPPRFKAVCHRMAGDRVRSCVWPVSAVS